MVLRVDFEQFPQTVKRVLGCNQAYVSELGSGSIVSAADQKSEKTLILSSVDLNPAEVRSKLEQSGMEVFSGTWSLGVDDVRMGAGISAYVAAVAYASEEPKPGLWMDAYAERPTLADVMRAMYDEFKANGEIPEDTSLEEFIRLASPNVVVLGPDQITNFIEAKIEC